MNRSDSFSILSSFFSCDILAPLWVILDQISTTTTTTTTERCCLLAYSPYAARFSTHRHNNARAIFFSLLCASKQWQLRRRNDTFVQLRRSKTIYWSMSIFHRTRKEALVGHRECNLSTLSWMLLIASIPCLGHCVRLYQQRTWKMATIKMDMNIHLTSVVSSERQFFTFFSLFDFVPSRQRLYVEIKAGEWN